MQSHAERKSGETEKNGYSPLLLLALLLAPYPIFLLLLMLVTGETDIVVLFTSVMQEGNWAYAKTWVIGSLLLSLVTTLLVSAHETKEMFFKRAPSPKTPRPSHHIIPVEPTFRLTGEQGGARKGAGMGGNVFPPSFFPAPENSDPARKVARKPE